jgi:4-amino-4-deoxychorismate lyase
MSAIIFRGNLQIEQLSANDRGLAYGDGLFETVLVRNGELIWWPEHWQRLCAGAARLAISLPDQQVLFSAIEQLIANKNCVLKMIVSRGESGRGYAPTVGPATTVLSVHPLPERHASPIALRWCQTQIAQQPALAGIKHLNRLENVLARAEWNSLEYADGLMCDRDGAVICATSANIFIYKNQQWRTPDVSLCGIQGVARQWFLANLADVRVQQLSRADVERAEAVFLCNAVRGMMEVNRIESVELSESAALQELQQRFLASNPAFVSN